MPPGLRLNAGSMALAYVLPSRIGHYQTLGRHMPRMSALLNSTQTRRSRSQTKGRRSGQSSLMVQRGRRVRPSKSVTMLGESGTGVIFDSSHGGQPRTGGDDTQGFRRFQ
ncbi:hypothetical protein BAUCODRAFT_28750 [Baudoinia panamericana UAMH 10762]|uniref:Uncharacterized protein n=1 Tax=Baudoinia panamericana (strain UAMH 10762) TaxID=717646 RepID=M2N8C6_BAUPA|nr:uncharacterized protein BAUCODRAFT_28750 [Baudoinia panamericana UAMH 10762]EMD00394.1 hypothetical protein BAUCODRAFT_28750 [Baudoinia panamericana UAMH 10762]